MKPILFVITLFCSLHVLCQEAVVDVFINSDEIDLSNAHINVLPSLGLYAAIGNKIFALDYDKSEVIDEIVLPDSLIIDDFIFADNDFMFKCGDKIIAFNNGNLCQRLMLDTSEFNIYISEEDRIFIVVNQDARYIIHQCKLSSDEIKSLISIPERIKNVFGNEESLFIVTDENIYSFKDNTLTIIVNFYETINSAISTPNGIYFGTDSGFYQLIGKQRVIPIAECSVSQMWYDNKVIYLLLGNNTILTYKF